MKKIVFILTASLLTSTAWAFTQVETFKVSSPNSRLREAAQAGLGISGSEAREKRDVTRMKTRHPQRYAVTNEAPNKFMNEIEIGLGKVDPAKALAKLYILKSVKNNWSRLRDSAFLESPTSNWNEAQRLMKKELERIVLVETASKTHFTFSVPWANAVVRKNLKEVEVTLTYADHLDGNTLPEGADKIEIPDEQ